MDSFSANFILPSILKKHVTLTGRKIGVHDFKITQANYLLTLFIWYTNRRDSVKR
jgi:hypothetical protein